MRTSLLVAIGVAALAVACAAPAGQAPVPHNSASKELDAKVLAMERALQENDVKAKAKQTKFPPGTKTSFSVTNEEVNKMVPVSQMYAGARHTTLHVQKSLGSNVIANQPKAAPAQAPKGNAMAYVLKEDLEPNHSNPPGYDGPLEPEIEAMRVHNEYNPEFRAHELELKPMAPQPSAALPVAEPLTANNQDDTMMPTHKESRLHVPSVEDPQARVFGVLSDKDSKPQVGQL